MANQTREVKLSKAFVMLADTLVADFDVVDLLQTLVETCTDILDATAAGLLLRDPAGELHVVASTSEEADLVEMVQLGSAGGPCWQCATTGEPVTIPDIAATANQWPEFEDAAFERGFRSVQATPLRLRNEVIGTMGLFDTEVGALKSEDIAAAQALCDVATIGILSKRTLNEQGSFNIQLQSALDSRTVIERAKGMLAQANELSMDEAFKYLRSFARSNNLGLGAVARALSDRTLDTSRVLVGSAHRRTSPSNLDVQRKH